MSDNETLRPDERKTIMVSIAAHAQLDAVAKRLKVPRWMIAEQALSLACGKHLAELEAEVKQFRAVRRAGRTEKAQKRAELRKIVASLPPEKIAELLEAAKVAQKEPA